MSIQLTNPRSRCLWIHCLVRTTMWHKILSLASHRGGEIVLFLFANTKPIMRALASSHIAVVSNKYILGDIQLFLVTSRLLLYEQRANNWLEMLSPVSTYLFLDLNIKMLKEVKTILLPCFSRLLPPPGSLSSCYRLFHLFHTSWVSGSVFSSSPR